MLDFTFFEEAGLIIHSLQIIYRIFNLYYKLLDAETVKTNRILRNFSTELEIEFYYLVVSAY